MQTDAQLYKPGDYGLNTRRTAWAVATAEARKDDPTGRVQLAAYIEEQMSFRGDRSYVFGVRVVGSSVTLCYYDRSAIVEAKPFDVLEDPFYLGWFLAMFQDDPSTYGFNAMMGYHDPFQLGREMSKSSTLKMRAELTRADETYNNFSSEQPNDIKLDELEVVKEITSHYEVVGRGTSVFRAHAAERKDLVVKFCWQVETRRNEWELMQAARRAVPDNIPEVFGFASLGNLTPVEKLIEKCDKHRDKPAFGRKHFRILVMKYYEGVEKIEDAYDFWELMLRCAECTYPLLRTLFNRISSDFIHKNRPSSHVQGSRSSTPRYQYGKPCLLQGWRRIHRRPVRF